MKLITLFVAFWKMKASNIFPKSEYVLKVKLQFPKNWACNVKTSSVKPDLLSKCNQHVQISNVRIKFTWCKVLKCLHFRSRSIHMCMFWKFWVDLTSRNAKQSIGEGVRFCLVILIQCSCIHFHVKFDVIFTNSNLKSVRCIVQRTILNCT